MSTGPLPQTKMGLLMQQTTAYTNTAVDGDVVTGQCCSAHCCPFSDY